MNLTTDCLYLKHNLVSQHISPQNISSCVRAFYIGYVLIAHFAVQILCSKINLVFDDVHNVYIFVKLLNAFSACVIIFHH